MAKDGFETGPALVGEEICSNKPLGRIDIALRE